MIIHVVGSLPRDQLQGNEQKNRDDNMKSACIELGKLIAKEGYILSAGSIRESTADFYFIEGYLQCKPNGKIIINLSNEFRPDQEGISNENSIKNKYKEADICVNIVDGTTYSRHINALRNAHLILIVGGGRGAATAGFAAPAMKKPVLAIPQFGGAAKDVFYGMQFVLGRSSLTDADIARLDDKWSIDTPSFIIQCIKKLVSSNPFSENISAHQLAISVVVSFCILTWPVLFFVMSLETQSSFVKGILFFLAMILSSVVGTSLRTLLKVYFDFTDFFSIKKLFSDYIIGISVAFSFFLIYSIGGILYNSSIISILSNDRILESSVFMSAVAFSGSLFLESSINKMRAEIQKIIDGPTR